MKKSRAFAPVVVAALALGLAACSSAAEPETEDLAPEPGEAQATEPESAQPEPSETSEPEPTAIPAELTAPGTELKFGEPAVINVAEEGEPEALVRVTVRDVTVSTPEQVADQLSDGNPDGYTGYTVRFDLEAVGEPGSAWDQFSLSDFEVSGDFAPVFMGVFDKDGCSGAGIYSAEEPGDKAIDCESYAGGTTPPDKVTYTPDRFAEFNGSPIVWTK